MPDRLALVAGAATSTYASSTHGPTGSPTTSPRPDWPGAHVGILARNRAEWVEAMIGCYKARSRPVNLNFRYVAPELRYVVDNADLEVLVYERALDRWWPRPSRAGARPTARTCWSWDRRGRPPRSRRPPPASGRGLRGGPGRRRPLRASGPAFPDDLYILYTGGTTGMPKGVLWRQEDIFFAAMGGGGWGRTPIATADELAGRHRHRRARRGADARGRRRSCTATPSGPCGTPS